MKANEAVQLLGDCEQKLRQLVADAASEGDYASVLKITDWAKAIAALAGEAKTSRLDVNTPIHMGVSVAGGNGATRGSSNGAVTAPRRGRLQNDYPKFFRRGDELVKVGWSKKERKEYSHRAPRKAVDAVAAAVRQIGARGKLFNGDALIPLKDPSDGSAVPDYQVYVALAWLTHLGVLDQRGRRTGYALVSQKQVDSSITTAWPELPEWRG